MTTNSMETKGMKTKFLLLALCSLGSLATAAEAPSYRNDLLTIPMGAVVNGTEAKYYKDIVLQSDSTGKFRIVSAAARPLVHVDNVNPVATETQDSRSAEVNISGYKSVPCTKLEDVAVTRKDNVFTILLAESVMGPAETCIAIIDPFTVKVPLDVRGLPAGTYKLNVNGVQSSFTLTRNP